MSKDDGGPAFPFVAWQSPDGMISQAGADPGMSLRDYFAGQALVGMISNENFPFSADVAEVEPRDIAEAVYELADAMLAARSKPGSGA